MSERVSLCAPDVPPICEREVLRYMGAREATDEVRTLLRECIDEARDAFVYRVCWRPFDIRMSARAIDLGFAVTESASLQKNLDGCDRVILFAATVGIGIDRLITRYTRLSPARAVCFGAIGAERIEALCDVFCAQMCAEYEQQGMTLRPRFSPGYGDLPLELQREIFRVLDCARQIGLSLNDSLLMSPTKSVTAIVGARANPKDT